MAGTLTTLVFLQEFGICSRPVVY